jgi:uncharacterized protein (DUF2252 family)
LKDLKLASDAPPAWCCADLHLENFGSYLGDNGLTYFDINDFDEAAIAPADRDILRLAASVLVAAPELAIAPAVARTLAETAIRSYLSELEAAKVRWIERRTADGAIGELLRGLRRRDPAYVLRKRTKVVDERRAIRLDGERALPLQRGQHSRVAAVMRALGAARGETRFYRPLDAARRVAGTGSLGLERYVVLVEGDGSPDENVLLDVKAARQSVALQASRCAQPIWRTEADRVVAIQSRCQAIPPARLSALRLEKTDFIVRELQPSADRLDLQRLAASPDGLAPTLATMGRLTAWSQLRAAAHRGAAGPDSLTDWSRSKGLSQHIMASARAMAKATNDDWAEFVRDYSAEHPGLRPQ